MQKHLVSRSASGGSVVRCPRRIGHRTCSIGKTSGQLAAVSWQEKNDAERRGHGDAEIADCESIELRFARIRQAG